MRETLQEAGEAAEHVYFPNDVHTLWRDVGSKQSLQITPDPLPCLHSARTRPPEEFGGSRVRVDRFGDLARG
jgi:hypothetical protein